MGDGLKLKCDCGNILESNFTFFLNDLSFGNWACHLCGTNYVTQFKIKAHAFPYSFCLPHKTSYKKVRLRCENCQTGLTTRFAQYINQLPNRAKVHCPICTYNNIILCHIEQYQDGPDHLFQMNPESRHDKHYINIGSGLRLIH